MSPSPVDQVPSLGDILDLPAVHALARDVAELHGIGFELKDKDGRILVRAGAGAAGEGSGGIRFVSEPLVHDGSGLGAIILGPLEMVDGERGERARRLLAHVRGIVSALVQAGLARHYTSVLHSESVIASHREVAELHRRLGEMMERQKELDLLKGNFLATMSHELRTPLTSVIGYSEMLLQGMVGELAHEQREYVQTIMDKGEQLLGLISSFIESARVGTGTLRVRREPVDVREAVAGALAAVRPVTERRRLKLSAEVAPGLPFLVADQDKVRQVLLNLLGNAVKFSPDGATVVVQADLGRLAAGDPSTAPFLGEEDAIRLSVRDSGIGIARENLERIFDPFYQVDGTSTREFGGTGIGLALVRSFVTAMGGRVWADSKLGQGSAFFDLLPLQRME